MFETSTLRDSRVLLYDPDEAAAAALGLTGATVYSRRAVGTPDGAIWAGVGYREGEVTEAGLRLTSVAEAIFTVPAAFPITDAMLVRDVFTGRVFNLTAVRPAVKAAQQIATGVAGDTRYVINDDVPEFTVATVFVNPTSYTGDVGDAPQFRATAYGQTGRELPAVPLWSSDDYAVVNVIADGTAELVSAGTATVTATVDGIEGTATVSVS